jgi:tRNA (adenine57-N1/adenine58-N1)-methyltransferase catalytic subunit
MDQQNLDRTKSKDVVMDGDLAMLVSPTNKNFIIRIQPSCELHTHRGIVKHDQILGMPWGSKVFTHKGVFYYILQPGLGELLRETARNTQIMYPKDIGFVLVMMGIGDGTTVLEAGTGSGALSTALAWAVGSNGHVFSYENRPEMQKLAIKNLTKLGLADRVTFKLRDIQEGFDESGMDAVFLDVQNAYDYLSQVRNSLKSGGFFGSIMPTTNQVQRLLIALYQNHFAFTDVCEMILRYYKPVPERLRPTDRMVAHTGYLVFSRKMLPDATSDSPGGDVEVQECEDAPETPDYD